jgi:fermentation-respiration switch protein FrsA (DUF1100 family)
MVIILVITLLYCAFSYLAFRIFSMPPGHAAAQTPIGNYLSVSYPARGRNYLVYAYLLPGAPDTPALIVVHGIGGTRHSPDFLDYAELLRSLGYTILLIDMSDGAGDTIGDGYNALGVDERWDVLGSFDYLTAHGFASDQIGLVGLSMGGATSILAAGIEPRLKAVWDDSGYARITDILQERLAGGGLIPLLIPGGLAWDYIFTGNRLWEVAPVDMLPNFAKNAQALYIAHGDQDVVVKPHHANELYAAGRQAGADVVLWSVAGGEHIVLHKQFPTEYLRRLDSFFKTRLR